MSAVLEPRHAAGGKDVDMSVKLAFSTRSAINLAVEPENE